MSKIEVNFDFNTYSFPKERPVNYSPYVLNKLQVEILPGTPVFWKKKITNNNSPKEKEDPRDSRITKSLLLFGSLQINKYTQDLSH